MSIIENKSAKCYGLIQNSSKIQKTRLIKCENSKNNSIIAPFKLGQDMKINQKASEFLKELCADVDFNKAGYRPPLKEPLILAGLDYEIMKSLEILGYKLENNELKVSTQKQLFHGMRLKKIADGRALSKADFLEMPLKITFENMYVGINKSNSKEIRFFWGAKMVI